MSGMTTSNTGNLRRKEVMMKKMKHGGKEEMSEMKAMKKGTARKGQKAKKPAKKKGK